MYSRRIKVLDLTARHQHVYGNVYKGVFGWLSRRSRPLVLPRLKTLILPDVNEPLTKWHGEVVPLLCGHSLEKITPLWTWDPQVLGAITSHGCVLKDISLSDLPNRLSDLSNFATFLESCRGLQKFTISGYRANCVPPEIWLILASMPTLQVLVHDCLNDPPLLGLSTGFKNLKSLRLSVKPTFDLRQFIGSNSSCSESISCLDLRVKGDAHIFSSLPLIGELFGTGGLTHLTLGCYNPISSGGDDSWKGMPPFPCLTHIKIEHINYRYTFSNDDDDIIALSALCPKAQTMDLKDAMVTHVGIAGTLRNCPNIRWLRVGWNVSDKAMPTSQDSVNTARNESLNTLDCRRSFFYGNAAAVAAFLLDVAPNIDKVTGDSDFRDVQAILNSRFN